MNKLPNEIIYEITRFLPVEDCISLSQTCIKMRVLCLEYLTRFSKNKKLNKILKKMKSYDFYDYYILKNKQDKHLEIMFNLYELKAKFSTLALT